MLHWGSMNCGPIAGESVPLGRLQRWTGGRTGMCGVMLCVNVKMSNVCVSSWFPPWPTWSRATWTSDPQGEGTDCSSLPFPFHTPCSLGKSHSTQLRRGGVGSQWLVSSWGTSSAPAIDWQTTERLKFPMALNPFYYYKMTIFIYIETNKPTCNSKP